MHSYLERGLVLLLELVKRGVGNSQIHICLQHHFQKGTFVKDPSKSVLITIIQHTVNSEIFAKVLFLGNFANAKFLENKILAKWRNYPVVY